jgi:hypothetical protein
MYPGPGRSRSCGVSCTRPAVFGRTPRAGATGHTASFNVSPSPRWPVLRKNFLSKVLHRFARGRAAGRIAAVPGPPLSWTGSPRTRRRVGWRRRRRRRRRRPARYPDATGPLPFWPSKRRSGMPAAQKPCGTRPRACARGSWPSASWPSASGSGRGAPCRSRRCSAPAQTKKTKKTKKTSGSTGRSRSWRRWSRSSRRSAMRSASVSRRWPQRTRSCARGRSSRSWPPPMASLRDVLCVASPMSWQ